LNSKERMLTALRNRQPDMVPVSPDISNMIPCKLTGKPFWDIYLYNNPPRWKAYIDAVRHFGFDGWLDDIEGVFVEDNDGQNKGKRHEKTETVIVFQSDERIITRQYREREKGDKEWSRFVTVYHRNDPPTVIRAEKIDLKCSPKEYWPIEGRKEEKSDLELLKEVKAYMGEDGVVGIYISPPQLVGPEGEGYSVYDYYDHYREVKGWSLQREEIVLNRLDKILKAPVKPDFILTGGSGLLVFNTVDILRDIVLPTLQKITRKCKKAGMPTQVHCCGPEKALVEICAQETDLNSINPLEIPPMGDCNLAEIKKNFGEKLSLMGNLHTTEIMLKGNVEDIEEAAKRAIDEAAPGGGFILSTGDQCGRDTPEENIYKLIEVARTYGRY